MSNISQRWTEERVTDLKRMNADGLSASEIARALGAGFSRNAVIGKLHRLTGYVALARPKNDRGRLANKISAGSFGRKPVTPKVSPPPLVTWSGPPVSILDDALGHLACRYIVSGSGAGTMFCAAPVEADAYPFRFCRDHAARCLTKTTRQHRQDARAA